MKRRLIVLFILLIVAIIGGYYFWFLYIPAIKINIDINSKPITITNLLVNQPSFDQNKPVSNNTTVKIEPVNKPDPTHIIKILNIPFTPQAPFANWDLPYQEACEEASMVMVAEYFKGNKVIRLEPTYADQEILKLVDWQKQHRGFYEDTTAAEVVSILKDYYKLSSQVVPYDPTVIKQEILAGRPVILPAAGRLLGNPYFRQPGPLYHMLVIKGYEENEFITNDPGTKRGLNFRYPTINFDRAVHDWNNGEVEKGEQVMIIIKGLIDKHS